MNKSIKQTIVIGLGIIAGFSLYTAVFAQTPETTTTTNGLVTTKPSSGPIAFGKTNIDKLLGLLLGINNIQLSNTLFQKPTFLSLKDLSLSDENTNLDLNFGRKNPFLPIGSDSVGGQTTTTKEVKTIPASTITKNSAILNAENTVLLSTISEQSFDWGISATVLDQKTAVNTVITKNFSFTLDGLLPETVYFYRPVVKLKNGKVVLGDIQSFKTLK